MNTAMTLSEQAIWAAIIGFVIGALVIWVIMRLGKGGASKSALQKSYNDLKKAHEDYQQQVNAHFAKTADAIDNLTQSYKAVFSHLSEGAQQLMDKETLQKEIAKRQGKAVTLTYLAEETTSSETAPTATKTESKRAATEKPAEDAPVASKEETKEAKVESDAEDAINAIKSKIDDTASESKK